MQFSAVQIATLINGKIEGNPEAPVSGVAKIEEAGPGALCFVANPKYEEYLYTTRASVVIVNEQLELEQPVTATLIRVPDAYMAFASLLEKYNDIMAAQGGKTGIEQPSFIAPTAKIGKDVYIGAFSYIGDHAQIGDGVKIYPGSYIGNNVVIGNHTKIFAGVKVYDACAIGAHAIIHSGTVVGGDGFGFAPLGDGGYKKVPQIGNVVIEDHVEIGANTTIDRATMGSTVVRKGVKLDNLIQVAHNAEIGENTVIAAQTGISGSTKIGRNCVIGGQVGMVGHIQIADGTKINAQSGISKSIESPNQVLNGTPAFDYKTSLKSQAIFRHLPEMRERIQKLEEMVAKLTDVINTSQGIPADK
jgi:UDP-3-O-[3-hydroxymyristoyl] glucosamine N-acyltransferase